MVVRWCNCLPGSILHGAQTNQISKRIHVGAQVAGDGDAILPQGTEPTPSRKPRSTSRCRIVPGGRAVLAWSTGAFPMEMSAKSAEAKDHRTGQTASGYQTPRAQALYCWLLWSCGPGGVPTYTVSMAQCPPERRSAKVADQGGRDLLVIRLQAFGGDSSAELRYGLLVKGCLPGARAEARTDLTGIETKMTQDLGRAKQNRPNLSQ